MKLIKYHHKNKDKFKINILNNKYKINIIIKKYNYRIKDLKIK